MCVCVCVSREPKLSNRGSCSGADGPQVLIRCPMDRHNCMPMRTTHAQTAAAAHPWTAVQAMLRATHAYRSKVQTRKLGTGATAADHQHIHGPRSKQCSTPLMPTEANCRHELQQERSKVQTISLARKAKKSGRTWIAVQAMLHAIQAYQQKRKSEKKSEQQQSSAEDKTITSCSQENGGFPETTQ
eukprot:scaffold27425_cov22-Tisochrysis_lutea.AAC.3